MTAAEFLSDLEPLIKGLETLQAMTQVGGSQAATALVLIDNGLTGVIAALKAGPPIDAAKVLADVEILHAGLLADNSQIDAEIAAAAVAEGTKP